MKMTVDLLTLSHVPRWAIIDTNRQQNVGEHSFRVMVIAYSITQWINAFMGDKVECGKVLEEALIHDIEEAISGDIPTPFKKKNGLSKKGHVTLESQIVKVADIAEAVIFLDRYGVRSAKIQEGLSDDLKVEIKALAGMLAPESMPMWSALSTFVREIVVAGGSHA